MFSFLTPYKLYIEIAIILIIVGGIAFGAHKLLAHERKVGYDTAVAEYAEKALIANQAARARELKLNTQVQEARNAATLRDNKILELSNKLSSTSDSLLDTINSLRNKLSASTAEASRRQADTSLTLLGECQERYGEMAENADRHASDVRMLLEAWPNLGN